MSWDVGSWVINTLSKAINNHKAATDALGTAVKTGGVPIVRKIQRGTVNLSSEGNSVTLNGFTNTNKMSVNLQGNAMAKGREAATLPYVRALTPSTLTVKPGDTTTTYNSCYVSYEVIEFY